MLQQVAFLAAIADAPRDAVHRLAYADWLDEGDRPLSALLRVQAEWLRPGRDDPAGEELARGERQFLV